ncbi:MAG TPA: arabinofuranosyltransferase [Micromonosporaceae bacterium]|nr:arabinofuranosyltransferase [Micromonosporaceae bacterium]
MATLAESEAVVDERPPGGEPPRRRVTGLLTSPSVIAIGVWAIGAPVAFLLPRAADLNPFFPRAWALAIGLALVAIAIFYWINRVRPAAEQLAAAGAGALAAWVLFVLRLALSGTPFGFGGLLGDAQRLAAGATSFGDSLGSSGYWIPGQPREYPPLYLMIVGKVAALNGEPGWRYLAGAEVIGGSLAVLVCFLLWRRLVTPWLALAITALVTLAYFDARKPYEVIALYVIVPWVLATFANPPRGRLHWLPAGLLGGLLVLTYQGWLIFGAVGIVALIVMRWRSAADRRGYLRHLAGVLGTAAIVSSWYVLPYLYATARTPSKMISDMYTYQGMLGDVFGFVGTAPMAILQAVGLVGLVWLRRTGWWAMPLLLLAASAFGYRVVLMLSFAYTGHTAFAQYAGKVVAVVLTAAGVLVLAHAVPLLLDRLAIQPARGVLAVVLAVVLGWVSYTFAMAWLPGTPSSWGYPIDAHKEPLPDGGYPRYAPAADRTPWFPVGPVQHAVEGVLGQDPRRVTLSYDDRLYSYLPWPGYLTTSRYGSGTFALFDQRVAQLRTLAATGDPAAFARASQHTTFGPIDIFVLHREPAGWRWRDITFQPEQFDATQWTVIDDLPEDTVVAIRR